MQVTEQHHFATVTDAKTFALAGNAIITLESLKTGLHYTFKIRESKPTPDRDLVYFVNLLAGPNNESDYVYLGIIRAGRFMLTKASKANEDSACYKAFNYFWRLQGDEFPSQLVVHHEMRCGRCNRTLTVPESIARGLGPECAEILGLDL